MTIGNTQPPLTIGGRIVPASMLAPLIECGNGDDPVAMLATHGYLLARRVHDKDEVLAARNEVLSRLHTVDEVASPFTAAVATGRSSRAQLHPDLGGFWRSVSEGPALRRVINGPRITGFMTRLLGSPAAPFTFAWLRAMAAGRASPLHIDHPYMNRGSAHLLTVWTPLGAVGLDEAPLYVIEGSHRWSDLRQRFQGLDVDRDTGQTGAISEHPLDLAAAHAARLLTATFEPGDALIFGMFAAHASFDNASTIGRLRLSCDTRFQPAGEPMDERFCGADPPAHGGKGYGCLSAAQPITAANLVR